jgi:hypothetical protein
MNLSQIRTILLSTYWERRNLGHFGAVWLIFGLAIAGAIIPLLFMQDHPKTWEFSLFLFLLISSGNLVLWWFALSSNLPRLASPTVKPFLPGGMRAIVSVYALSWLATTTIFALLFLIIHVSFLTAFFFAGLGLLLLTLIWGSGNWLWGVPFYLNGFWSRPAEKYVEKLVSTYGATHVLSFAMVGLITFFVLSVRVLFFRKGERAFAAHMKILKRIDAMSGNPNPNKVPEWQQQLSGIGFYDWSLRRIERRSMGVNRQNVLRFLPYGFGMGLHWSAAIGSLLWALLVSLAIIVFLSKDAQIVQTLFNPNGLHTSFIGFLQLMMILGGCQRSLLTLHQTRREQQLLCLLPFIPSRQMLGRTTMTLLIRQAAIWVACSALAAMLFTLMILRQLPWQSMMGILQSTLISCVALFFLFPDFSRMSNPKLKAMLMIFAGILLYVAMNALNYTSKSFPVSLFGSVLVAAGAAIYTFIRWHRMPQLAAAFPVGRLD